MYLEWYIPPGTYKIPDDTRYMGVAVRTEIFNPNDKEELALVHKLQDQFVIKVKNSAPFPEPKWDMQSLDAMRAQYEKDGAKYDNWDGMQGPRGKVNEETRHIAAATAWGLFPEKQAWGQVLRYNIFWG